MRTTAPRWRHASRRSRLDRRKAVPGSDRARFARMVDEAIIDAGSLDRVAVLLLEVDRFREISAALGSDGGEAVLEEVRRRIIGSQLRGEALGRLGPDTFAVLTRRDGRPPEIVAETLLEMCALPVVVQGVEVYVEVRLGVARWTGVGETASSVVRRAESALLRAQTTGRTVEHHESSTDERNRCDVALLAELRAALVAGGITAHFQPKVATGSGALVGVEALARWEHETLGWVPPTQFVALAERTQLLFALTELMLGEVWGLLSAATRRGQRFEVAVNVAPSVLNDRLVRSIASGLRRTGVAPQLLVVEITESAFMGDDHHRAHAAIEQLGALGVRVSLDDFGVGQSSLAQVGALPIDELKLDRSFVGGIDAVPSTEVVLRWAIQLGRAMGLRTVAEGVETVEQRRALLDMGCDAIQGFLIAPAMPASTLFRWLDDRGAQDRRETSATLASATGQGDR